MLKEPMPMISGQSQHRLCGVSRAEFCCRNNVANAAQILPLPKRERKKKELQSWVYFSYRNGKVKMATDI